MNNAMVWLRFRAPLLLAALVAPAHIALADIKTGSGSSGSTESEADSQGDTLQAGRDKANRLTLPVVIDGRGPYPFIIDTASHATIISSELATELNLPSLAPVTVFSLAGRQRVPTVKLDGLSFGKQTAPRLAALSIDSAHIGSVGLLGLDGLRDKRLVVDFRWHRLRIDRSRSEHFARRQPGTIVVGGKLNLGQLILVDSKVNNEPVNVILDTGAEYSVGNLALYERLKHDRLVTPPIETMVRTVTGAQVPAYYTVVGRVQIGSFSLTDVPMVFVDLAPLAKFGLADQPTMLLGMKMLRMFDRVSIDFGAQHVDFQLPQDGGKVDTMIEIKNNFSSAY